ncbi:glycosyltransferase family 87 protein [Cupriavidus basilensis]
MSIIQGKSECKRFESVSVAPGSGSSQRLLLYSGALLLCECILFSVWWWERFVLNNPGAPLFGWDFAVYWSASSVAMSHGAAAAYDWDLLRSVEASILPAGVFGPFAYPPTFLALIYPIARLSFSAALLAFSASGIVLYLIVLRSAVRLPGVSWLVPALAFPGIWVAFLAGQNSLLTLAAAGGALVLLRRKPVAAGACIAMLCVKPQLGVLFPLMLLCARQWRAMASAGLFSLLYGGLVFVAFGSEAFVAFAHSLAEFRLVVAENGGSILHGAPTVFAIARVAGNSVSISYLAHALVSLIAVAIAAWVWTTGSRFELRAAVFPVATVLLQPYLIYYDLAWLALPIAFLTVDFARHGWTAFEATVLVAAWLVPGQGFIAIFFPAIGQWAPAVLVCLLVIIARRNSQEGRGASLI